MTNGINENELKTGEWTVSASTFKQIKERDTILVIYVKGNDFYGKIYKSFPTKEAIKKYREGVYYKKRGKFIRNK